MFVNLFALTYADTYEERCQTADTGLDCFAETTGEKWKKN
jgi:hypothetical protein